jgi:pyrimidine-specific ribonucleoside hydrolase
MGAVKPVIIDTDMASDDWMAILYLLRHPRVSVEAITVTGTGEAHSQPGAFNALGLLALAGQPDVPVAFGTETPLQGHHAFPDTVREMMDSVMGIPLPVNPNAPLQQGAVEFLVSYLRQSRQKVTLLALGPLTNLALAFQADPSLVECIEMLYIMGGAVDVPGNLFESGAPTDNTVAEWNIYCDPYAAKVVVHSGAPITLVPLDATNQAPLTMEFYHRMEQDHSTPEAGFLWQVMLGAKESIPTGRAYFWDPLTAAILADEGLAAFEQRQLTVIVEEGPQSGRTLETDAGANVRVCTAVDSARFEDLFLDVLNGRFI